MSELTIAQLPLPERRYVAIRQAVRVTGKRLRINAHDREVAVQCAMNAYRTGASAAAAVARGTQYLRSMGGVA